MMYHPFKFSSQKISSSADMVEAVISDDMSPHCDPELEDSKINLLAWHFGPWCCITITSLVTGQQRRRYRPDEHSLEFLTYSVTFTLTTTDQSNLSTRQSTLWWCAIKPSLVAKGSAGQILKRHILITIPVTLTLTLKTANQSFWQTIWLIMMHHHTTFGSKRFSVSKDIIWTNIHCHLEILLWPWPWTQQSDFSIKHSGFWKCTIKPSLVAKRSAVQKIQYIIWALA